MSGSSAIARSASLRKRGLALVTAVAMLVGGGISLAAAPAVVAVPMTLLACGAVATKQFTLAPNEVLTVSLDPGTCRSASVPGSGYFGAGTVDLHLGPSAGFSRLAAGQTASESYDSVMFIAPSTVRPAAVQFTVGKVSFEITVVVPATVPDAPVRVVAWVAGPTAAYVYFAAPGSDGFSPIDHFTVTSSPAGGTGTLSGAEGRDVYVTGLTTGVAYTFTVTATNGVGTSAPSWPSDAVTPVLPLANDDIENAVALAAGTVSATGDNTLATLQQGEYNGFRFSGPHTVWFTWTAPESSTGTATIDTCDSPIDTNLAVFAAGTFTTPLAENDDSCNFASSVTLPVTPGASYSIQVSGAGEEQFGVFVLNYSFAGATVPGAPASGSATGGAGSIGLGWTAPRRNGGDTVTGYRIDVSDVSNSAGFTTLVATQPGLSYADTGLGDGVTRWYRVYAINGKGTGGSYLALSGTTAIPVVPTPGGGGGSSSPAADSGSGSSEPAVTKPVTVPVPVVSTLLPAAATTLIRQTARITAPSSRRFAVGTRVMLAAKPVKTSAGVTVKWRARAASAGICTVATVQGRAVATMLRPGTCRVVGTAAAPSRDYAVFQATRTYRAR